MGCPLYEIQQRDVGIVGPVRVKLSKQGDHADEAGNRKYADGHGRLLADVDFALGDVVQDRQRLGVCQIVVKDNETEGACVRLI